MSSLASLWAKYYHMEGMILTFECDDTIEACTLKAELNGVVIFNELLDYCISCRRKKAQEKTQLELLKKLNFEYVTKYA